MELSETSHHNSPSNCSTVSECENDAENSLNCNFARKIFIDTYTFKVEQDVPESCDEQIRNNNTNSLEIKSEPQFYIKDENDLMKENHRATGCNLRIKSEAEDIAVDESCSNLNQIPFASIDYESFQDEDQLHNQITSELIIKSENEWSEVEESRDNNADSENENYTQDLISEATENKTSAADFQEKRKKIGKKLKFCSHCKFTTHSKHTLRNHMQAHVRSECEIGHQVDAEFLKCAVAQTSSYPCQICGRVHKYKAHLTKHLKLHGNNQINDKGFFECEVCKKQFVTAFRLSRHKEIHLNRILHKCLQCDKEFKSKIYLKNHVINVHEAVRSFNCTHNQCSKSFKSKKELQIHLKIHSGVRKFKCDKCPKSFICNTHIKQHKRYVHSEVKPFVCKICVKSFKKSTELLRHGRVHSDLRPFSCEKCGKTFKSKNKVKQHMSVHNVELNFKCEQCDKKFKSKQLLYSHKRVHAIKKFQCASCDKKFKTKPQLSQHMSVHSDVCPFSCDICAKTFKSKRELKLHGVVHKTSYDFKCNLCEAVFKCKGNLEKHKKYCHSDARPFKCNECEKSYKTKQHLKYHIAGHLNFRQFKCDKCDRSFNTKGNLKSHSAVHC